MLEALFFLNYLFFVAILSYLIAQGLKAVLYTLMNRKLDIGRLLGSGGMPSSHSATVAALAVGALQKCGPDSPITAVALILAIIVIYDATGVRQEAGKHAQLLNRMLHWEESEDLIVPLNEMVGHTSFQVLVGAVIGILVAVLVPVY